MINLEKAYILISCDIGKEQLLFSKLKDIPEISDCLITYGDYDIVAKFQTGTIQQMDDVISSKIRKLDNIRSTITLRVSD